MPDVKCVLIHDNFQNFKSYNIPKAQLVIADIPYNIGTDFYASRPDWYVDGDNKNGESSKARKAAFNTDSMHYHGSNAGNGGAVHSDEIASHGRQHSLSLTLPPLATIWLVREAE